MRDAVTQIGCEGCDTRLHRSRSQTRLDVGTNLMRADQWGSLDGWNKKRRKDEGTGDWFMVDLQS